MTLNLKYQRISDLLSKKFPMAEPTESSPSIEIDDFSWIIGKNNVLSHIRMIDRGGAGEVHEVLPLIHQSSKLRFAIMFTIVYTALPNYFVCSLLI